MFDVYLSILLTPAALFVVGLLIGSFLNVVIHRLPLILERQWRQDARDMLELGDQAGDDKPLSLSQPASRCPSCGHQIRWYENIPLVSWLVLRGKCSGCGSRISWRYPLVELATGLLFAACAWRFGPHPFTLAWCGVVAVLVAASLIDWDTTLLPDDLTLPLLWAGLVAAGLGWASLPLHDALWGAVAGYLSLWSVYWVFKKATGKEGMGYGDFKLLAALGAWLGWKMLLPIILISSIIGAVVGIALKIQSSLREGQYVPFGPFLAGAGLVVLFAGEARVLDWFGW
ncbi:prepilin peptidase [Aquabacterium soli]|uniref:Prepilin leader peptidase/N-methyltransferase n=1 Tax=Aquabacterium soli TaxID=2493092 RepID=A0A3R8S225_9BURK|nr:A24 family peptidase [Aquabacterium soli]RRS04359.1 prepilin peptidase [Aquabacterium soli]